MARIRLYDYKSYKQYLMDWLEQSPAQGRGQRKIMAEAIGCQTPFVTQVLGGDYHLSPEQAEACARWLHLNLSETEYFLLLVLRARAGTKGLEDLLDRQLQERREQESQLKNRLKIADGLTMEDQIVYYSSWLYPAIHMALMNPQLQSLDSLNDHFKIPTAKLMAILAFLSEKKLVRLRAGKYEVIKPALHLGAESPLLPKHHTNWRLRAIQSIEDRQVGTFHFSAAMSISRQDYDWIATRLAQTLEELVDRVKNSGDEKLAAMNFDLFPL